MHGLCLLMLWFAPPQSTSTQQLALGRLLVASRSLTDPNFTQTVVLLVHFEPAGVVGLILNRRTQTPVATALQNLKSAQRRPDFAFQGGPVEPGGVLGLLRGTVPPEFADPVLGDVALVAGGGLDRAIGAADAKNLRIYLGYAGWDYQQLQIEVKAGGWYIFPGSSAQVFDDHPESLWSRLIRQTEGRIARR